MPRDDFAGIVGFADDDVRATPARVLWVGDDELIPGGDGWRLGDDLAYTASTAQAVPGVADLWPATADGASERMADALTLALDHDTTRLGRVLAPMGVRYIAVPRRLAPDRRHAPHHAGAGGCRSRRRRAGRGPRGAARPAAGTARPRARPVPQHRGAAAALGVPRRCDRRPGRRPSGARRRRRRPHRPGVGAGWRDGRAGLHGLGPLAPAGGRAPARPSTGRRTAGPTPSRSMTAALLAWPTGRLSPCGRSWPGRWRSGCWCWRVALRMRFGPGDAPSPEGPAVAEDEPAADPAADQAPPERVLVGQASDA